MPGTDPITVYRGEAVSPIFTMDPGTDISGWAILFTVEASGHEKIISKTATVTDGPGGEFQVALDTDDTNIRAGYYRYDAWRVDAGSERILAVGQFIVSAVARLPEP